MAEPSNNFSCDIIPVYFQGLCEGAGDMCDTFSDNWSDTADDATMGFYIAAGGLATYGVLQSANVVYRIVKSRRETREWEEELLSEDELPIIDPSRARRLTIKTQITIDICKLCKDVFFSNAGKTAAAILGLSLGVSSFFFGSAISKTSNIPEDFCANITGDCLAVGGDLHNTCEAGEGFLIGTIDELSSRLRDELGRMIAERMQFPSGNPSTSGTPSSGTPSGSGTPIPPRPPI